jgi:hypothetical protein
MNVEDHYYDDKNLTAKAYPQPDESSSNTPILVPSNSL